MKPRPRQPKCISQPPRGRVSLRHETVRLGKLPAVDLPRQDTRWTRGRNSTYWSRIARAAFGAETEVRPPATRPLFTAGGGAHQWFCGGLLIKLLIEYQYSSPTLSAEAGNTARLSPLLRNLSKTFKARFRRSLKRCHNMFVNFRRSPRPCEREVF